MPNVRTNTVYNYVLLIPGEIQLKGVVRPIARQVYEPMLKKLKDEGVDYTITVTKQNEREKK